MTPTATTRIVPAASPTEAGPPPRSLAHLPVTLFASVMGLGGLSLAWRRAANVWDLPQWPALTLLALATLTFALLGVLYTLKWARHQAAARAELRHPVQMTFAPTITISVLVFVVLLLAQVPHLRRLPFGLPAWAYTFPIAAASAAAISMAAARPQVTYDVVAVLLLSGTTMLVLAVAALTLRAAARRQICVPE